MKNNCSSSALAIGVLLTMASIANASLILPAGGKNPSGPAQAGPGALGGFTLLDPSPAIFEPAGSCPWLLPALKKQGFDVAAGNLLTLKGDIELDTYLAWVDTRPGIKQGAITRPASPAPDQGGANFGIGYHSKAGDPTDSVHWVQVIHTNDPLGRAKDFAVDEGNGFFDYIDDIPDAGKPTNPYYDCVRDLLHLISERTINAKIIWETLKSRRFTNRNTARFIEVRWWRAMTRK